MANLLSMPVSMQRYSTGAATYEPTSRLLICTDWLRRTSSVRPTAAHLQPSSTTSALPCCNPQRVCLPSDAGSARFRPAGARRRGTSRAGAESALTRSSVGPHHVDSHATGTSVLDDVGRSSLLAGWRLTVPDQVCSRSGRQRMTIGLGRVASSLYAWVRGRCSSLRSITQCGPSLYRHDLRYVEC